MKRGTVLHMAEQPLWHWYVRNGSLVALAVALALALLA